MLGLAGFGRKLEGSWIGPGTFYALIWAGYVAGAMFFIVDFEVFRAASLVLVVGCLTVMAGSVAMGVIDEKRATRPVVALPPSSFPWLREVVILLILLTLGEIAIVFARAGSSLKALASFAIISQVSQMNRSSFGYGDLQQGFVEKVLFIFVYAAPLFGGTLLAARRKMLDRVLGVITLALCWLVATLYGSRMGALFGGAFWVAGYMASYIAMVGVARSGALFVRVMLTAGLAVFGISILAMIARYGAGSGPSLATMVNDPFGFVTAFAYWVQDGGIWQSSDLYWGQRTFERLLGFFVTTPERPGAIDVGFTTSNIYTIYRSLVEDFGPVGALLALAALGGVGQWAFRRAAAGRIGAVAILAVVYATMFVSFSLSVFMYTSTTVAILLYVGYCVAVGWQHHAPPVAVLEPA